MYGSFVAENRHGPDFERQAKNTTTLKKHTIEREKKTLKWLKNQREDRLRKQKGD